MIACVIAPPGFQALPVVLLEVRVTLPPVQKLTEPPAVIAGVEGNGLTVTTVAAEVAEHPFPFVKVTVYEPEALAVIV